MMSTKIINILQRDRFDSIIKLFREASAEEVIFVLPKKTEILNSDEHFSIIADIAAEQGKNILILTPDPEINELALRYNFGVLTGQRTDQKNSDKKRKPKKIIVEESVEEREREVSEEEVKEEDESPTVNEIEDDSSDAEGSNVVVDILRPKTDESVSVRISKKPERSFQVNVKKEDEYEEPTEKEKAMDQIRNMWLSQPDAAPLPEKQKKPDLFVRKPIRYPKFSFFNLSRKTLTVLGASVAVLFFVILFISTGSAKIVIKPRMQPLDFTLKVFSSDQFQSVDIDKKFIPGQLFSVEKRVEDTFQATGEKDVAQKARGKITVYNEYGTATQVLVATTRFESSKGLVFRTLKTVTVPGTRVVNGEIIPGSVVVEVIADKAGEAYNIEPGKFTIPAFKEKGDNDRYQKFYGQSKESMAGGIVGRAKIVTDSDYLQAKEAVHNRLISEIEQELKTQTAGLKIIDLPKPTGKELISTAQVDEAVNEFKVSETAELRTIGFKEADLHAFIAGYIGKLNNLEVLPDKLQIDFDNVAFNADERLLEFTLIVRGPAYSRIDKEKIVADLMNKNEDQIKDYVKGFQDIASARVILSPFWVKRVPTEGSRVSVELNYE